MKAFINRLQMAGVDTTRNTPHLRNVVFLNTLSLFVLVLVFGNLPLTLAEAGNSPARNLLVGVIFLHGVMVSFTVVLNSFKLYKTARIYFGLMAANFMCTYGLLIGVESRWAYFLPLIIFLQFYIFPATEKRWMYFIIGYCAISFAAYEIWAAYDQPLANFPAAFVKASKYVNSAGFLFCAVLLGMIGYNTINRAERKLAEEHLRSETLLLNILPHPIANRLKNNPGVIADNYQEVSIIFADIVEFTKLSANIPADELVELLNSIFSKFDDLADRFGLEKIKTIGDAYMAVAGVPTENRQHAFVAASMALAMIEAVNRLETRHEGGIKVRIGICSGPVIAGVIGKRKFSYDLWGDSVNTAARMQSSGIAGEIQVTESTYRLLKNDFDLAHRGVMEIKGKGPMNTYLIKGAKRS